MFDYHVHTAFSGDCSVDMEDVLKLAIKKGLKEICFTDHLDIDSTDGSDNFIFSHKAYGEKIQQMRDKYSKEIIIRMGVEVGLQPHVLEASAEFIDSNIFDFALGSMHCCEQLDFYLGDFFKKYSTEEAILHYYRELETMVNVYQHYSVLGHMDIYKRYNPSSMAVPFHKYDHLVERVLKTVISNGKGIEINTSGIRGTIKEGLPSWEIIELYKELGGEIITLGSDSHGGDTLSANFEEVLRGLKVRNFKNIYRFKRFEPLEVAINTLL